MHSMRMQLNATDGVNWSVCISVGHSCEPCKTAELTKMPTGVGLNKGSSSEKFVKNYLRFDKIMAKSLWSQFLAHPVIKVTRMW